MSKTSAFTALINDIRFEFSQTDPATRRVFVCALVAIFAATAAQMLIALDSLNLIVVASAALLTLVTMITGIIAVGGALGGLIIMVRRSLMI